MAFRPTIAVVIDNMIADIGYYRNWAVEDLFIEALGIAVLYRDCRTIEEYRERVFGTQKISYIVDPEVFENTQENLRFFEDCSEMPITVDLSRGMIYEGYCDSDDDFILGKPVIEDMLLPVTVMESFYWDVLTKHRICFDRIDMESITDLFMNNDELVTHLSQKTAKMMRKMISERSGGSNDETGIHRSRGRGLQKGRVRFN